MLRRVMAGITVNVVAPGYVNTDMVRAVPENVLEKIVASIPIRQPGHAGDIARKVKFMAADDADFITGSTLSVNGGQHIYQWPETGPSLRNELE